MAVLSEKFKDRLAAGIIRAGGIVVILAVIAIVANIAWESLPLFGGAKPGKIRDEAAQAKILQAGLDPRQEVNWRLDESGVISFSSDLPPLEAFGKSTKILASDLEIHDLLSLLSSDGRLLIGRVRFRDSWTEGQRSLHARWKSAADELEVDPERPWAGITANTDSDGAVMAALWDREGRVEVHFWDSDDEEWEEISLPDELLVSRVVIAEDLGNIACIDEHATLRVFQRSRRGKISELEVEDIKARPTFIRYLIGGGSLILGDSSGGLSVLLKIPRVRVENTGKAARTVAGVALSPGENRTFIDDELGRRYASAEDLGLSSAPPVLRVVRSLPSMGAGISTIAPSPRRRGFLVGTERGRIGLFHATSGRKLFDIRLAATAIHSLEMAPKANGFLASSAGGIHRASFSNPHPEISFRTLFLPVWYEGYARPRLVWQSTGGSDAFEAKLSLIPLIFGSLKATLYAMLFSVPLALLSALYVSQLAPASFRSLIKPLVELMAAVPSVVVGFLAALWLAPRLEKALLASLISLAVLPLAVLLALGLWRVLPDSIRRRLRGSSEILLPMAAAALLLFFVTLLIQPVETGLFGGDFSRWLFTATGMRYDQRNALVVGIALGFAVIPVIFTIAEDAFSSVPNSLINASRALGATRWQTARHLVLPAGSAGALAAIVLGLGRAIGETMIVLMAAGNTPLLDFSPFNGMRTMSAAIAVEIPEAPVGGSLFRVLFLTGFLLFLFTLILTTAADRIGKIMRRKYGAQ